MKSSCGLRSGRPHVLGVRIHELEPPPRRVEVGHALVDAQDEPAGHRRQACGRFGEPAHVHALGITLDLLDQREEPEKASGAHVTAVVDHEHFGEARARRVTPDAVAEREGERVPDQRAIVDDGVGQHPIGVAGQPEHRPIAVGILVVGAQLHGVLLLRKVARRLAAHVNADAGIERGAADDAAGARLRLQHLERRRDVFSPKGIQRPRLERVNQDDWQVAREALRIRVHAQVDFRGDGSLTPPRQARWRLPGGASICRG